MRLLYSLILVSFISLNIVHAEENKPPKIISISVLNYTWNGPGTWIQLSSKGTLELKVRTENTKHVRLWLVPTGTETWKFRQMIGSLKNEKDGWYINWSFEGSIFHHLVIEAVGSNGKVDRESISVSNQS